MGFLIRGTVQRKKFRGKGELVSRSNCSYRMASAELAVRTPSQLIVGFISRAWKFIFAVIR